MLPSPPSFSAVLAVATLLASVVLPISASHAQDTGSLLKAPQWYLENPVQIHTRLSPIALERNRKRNNSDPVFDNAFANAAAITRSMGGSVLTRHVKAGPEEPSWSTQVPVPNANTDLVAEMVAEARRSNVRLIGYHWHMADNLSERLNPGWACRNRKGEVAEKRGSFLDFASPYRNVIGTRLQELVARGVNGFYFDGLHIPNGGCYGSATEQAFRAQTGASGRSDPAGFLAFNGQVVRDAFRQWAQQLSGRDLAVMVSMGRMPGLTVRDLPLDLARTAIPKTEFEIPTRGGVREKLFRGRSFFAQNRPERRAQIAFGLSLLREVSGNPPHVWLNNIRNPEELYHASVAAIAYGGVANIDIDEQDLGAGSSNVIQRASAEVLRLNPVIGQRIAASRPVRFAALHYSEAARNRRDDESAWGQIVAPLFFAQGALMRNGVPSAAIDDVILERGDLGGFRYLFTSAASELTPGQLANLARYGVQMIALPQLDAGGAGVFDQAVAPAVAARGRGEVVALVDAPDTHATVFRNQATGGLTVFVVAAFDHIEAKRVKNEAAAPRRSGRLATSLTLQGGAVERLCGRDARSGAALARNSDGSVRLQPAQAHVLLFDPC